MNERWSPANPMEAKTQLLNCFQHHDRATAKIMKLGNPYIHLPEMVKPLTDLTSPKTKFDEQDIAFQGIKEALISSPVLAYPDGKKDFRICCDASDYAIGGTLEQKGEDGLYHVVSYGGKKLSGPQLNWSEKEAYAVVFFLQHWRHYVLQC